MTIAEVESRARLLYFLENNLTVTASPAGSDTYIQFNDDGSMGGDTNLTWNKTTTTLTLGGVSADTDNTVLILNSSNEVTSDEIDSKVWAGNLVDYTGTPVDNQVAVWKDADTLEGDSSLTWDGATLDVDGTSTFSGVGTHEAHDIFETGITIKNADASAGYINFYEQSSNGTNVCTFRGKSSMGNCTITLPGQTGIVVLEDNTVTLTNKTLTSPTITGPTITGNTSLGTPTSLSDNTGAGDVITFGTEDGSDTLAAGRLMYLNDSGVWKYADGDAASTGGSQLLAIALGAAVSDGLLLRGFFDMATYFQGTFDQGVPLYVSTTAGSVAVTAPSATGDFVRVVGYCTDTANVIYFNPDGTYIEVS